MFVKCKVQVMHLVPAHALKHIHLTPLKDRPENTSIYRALMSSFHSVNQSTARCSVCVCVRARPRACPRARVLFHYTLSESECAVAGPRWCRENSSRLFPSPARMSGHRHPDTITPRLSCLLLRLTGRLQEITHDCMSLL